MRAARGEGQNPRTSRDETGGCPPIGTPATTHRIAAIPLGARLDIVLVSVVAGLTLGGIASVLTLVSDARIYAPSLDLVSDTLATLVAMAIGALAWVRFREHAEPAALFQSAAFLVLAIVNGTAVVLATTGLDERVGWTLSAPGQTPLYVFTLARLLAAGLLVVGGVGALRGRHTRRGVRVLMASTIAMLGILALLVVPAGYLPALGADPTSIPVGLAGAGGAMPGPTLLGAIASVLVAGLLLWAAALSRRLYRRDGSIGNAYLAVGLTVASFAQGATTIYPGLFTGVVTGGDLLWLAFNVILLLGIQAQMHATLGDLRVANADLARLRVVEVERAGLAERVRLSRELHDGLAQNLWLAKLKAGRLAALPDRGPEAAALTDELAAAIEAGLVEAQHAVAAMRLSGEPSGTLQDLLSRSVEEFADRFSVRAEFECATDLPSLSPRTQAEALRIAQEAMSNVRRHADATVVRVRAFVDTGRLVIAIRDNGRGFDPGAVGQGAFGIAGMRERAALIGGELSIESAPHDGTRVSLVLPLVPVVAVARIGPR